LKPERWGSLLVQEKYQEEKACDKRHPYRIIIIIIITITTTTIIIIPLIFNLSTSWRCVVSCTPQLLYTQQRTPLPIENQAGWAPELFWAFWRIEKFVIPIGIQTMDFPSHSLQTILTILVWSLCISAV
jgi:hypothetical protein